MRDAEEAEFPPTSLPRVPPRHPEVWIQADGRWWPGRVTSWVWVPRPAPGRWVVWASWRGDAGSEVGSVRAWLVYDPETIRVRDGDEAPGG